MPERTFARHVRISPQFELLIMIFLGMVRSVMGWLSFTWDGNVQEIWNLSGPSPSFSAEYHFDYWLKTILSFVVLFRNFTTHLHLLFYVLMLYPVLTGEQHRLILPWLYLHMLKNIVTDVICTVIGVLLCWLLHSCGLLTLEFLFVRIISMMPSIYLWRRIRSYYFDLYYAKLDGEPSFPPFKTDLKLTLAQRRRAAKSLDGAMIAVIFSDEEARANSCLTHDEFFRTQDWNADTDKKISKSLTTLLTIESQESDELEEDSRLQIMDNANLTPAEKTMRILGITRENTEHKKTSTNDVNESSADTSESSIDVDEKFSFISVTRESIGPRTVAIQVRFPDGLKNVAEQHSGKCVCCEETKCSVNNDEDSDEEDNKPMSTKSRTLSMAKKGNNDDAGRSSKEKSSNCCNENRRTNGERKNAKGISLKDKISPSAVTTSFAYRQTDLCPIPCLRAIVERDGIDWDNLKEINFVSVIDKVLSDELKFFKLQRNSSNSQKSDESPTSVSKNPFEDTNVKVGSSDEVNAGTINQDKEKFRCQSSQGTRKIFPEREDGTQSSFEPLQFSLIEKKGFSLPTSASFGADSEMLTLNASCVFDETPVSGIQSIDSMTVPTNSLVRLHQDVESDSFFQSSFQQHSNMFNDLRAELGRFQYSGHSSTFGTARAIDDYSRFYQMDKLSGVQNDAMTRTRPYDSSQLSRSRIATTESEINTFDFGCNRSTSQTPNFRGGHRDSWDFGQEVSAQNEINCIQSSYGDKKSRDLIFTPRDCYDHDKKRIISNAEVQVSSLTLNSSSINPTRVSHQKTFSSQRGTAMNDTILNAEKLVKNSQTSNHVSVGFCSNLDPERSVIIENSTITSVIHEKSPSKECDRKDYKDRRSWASSSKSLRSSESKKRSEKWEDKTLQALKAYNEKTLYKYKRDMDARKCRDVMTNVPSLLSRREENELLDRWTGSRLSPQESGPSCLDHTDLDPLSLSASIYGSNVNQALYVPSSPELETPEKELIFNIENAYARLTRSKPAGPVASAAFHQSAAVKEFFDLYSEGGRLKRDSQKMRVGDETKARKQHSKYSKFSRETNESDITSRSCKRIEGSQKGRDLDRTLAKENITTQEFEVYFLERQADERPSSSKNVPITTIKSFSRKQGDDDASVVSSETLTPDDSTSPMIEVLENPEEIPCRIDDNEFYREMRKKKKKNLLDNVREVMENIDWSFRRSYCIVSRSPQHEGPSESTLSTDHHLEHQNIVQKTTENMLQGAFANSDNSERGFCLGELGNEYYPIFNDVAIAMEEIVRAAGLRGYRDEFTSQPATEIEVPEIDCGNLYGALDLPVKLPRSLSSRRFSRCDILAEETKASNSKQLGSMVVNPQDKIVETSGREIFEGGRRGRPEWRSIEDKKTKNRVPKEEEEADEKKNEISSLTNFEFLLHGEIQKLHMPVKVIANYTTVTEYSLDVVSSNETTDSPSAIKSSYEANSFDVRRRELITGSEREKPDSFQNAAKDREKSNRDDDQAAGSSRSTENPVDRISSWDKMIPLSTKRELAKSRQKSKATKRAVAMSEPYRRIVKVIKLVTENDSDFFSARYVPQRGRGLSSGYLMDSDSDGNFTISRPPTPTSVESETSQTLYFDRNEDSDVPSKHLAKTSEVTAASETERLSRRSLSKVSIKQTFPSTSSPNLKKNFKNSESELKIAKEKIDDDVKSLENSQRSLKKSSKVSLDDDKQLHVLSAEILLTDSALKNISPIDAIRIVNQLTTEVQQILINQFRGVRCLTDGLPAAPKNGNFITLSDDAKIDSLTDIQGTSYCDSVENVEDLNRMKESCEQNVEEIMRIFFDELIAQCKDGDGISENSEDILLEQLQQKSIVSLKHVATGTEFTAEVFRDLLETFSRIHSIGNNVIPIYGNKNNIDDKKRGIPSAERSHNDESSPSYLDGMQLIRVSSSPRQNSPSSTTLRKNSIAEVELSQSVELRNEKTIDENFFVKEGNTDISGELNSMSETSRNECILEQSHENVVKKLDGLNPSFASYDSFASLLSQKRNEVSEKSSREISLSDHTFLEEFPDGVNPSIDSSLNLDKVLDKRSSDLLQSNSQNETEETDSEERSNKKSSPMNSATSISSESNSQNKKRDGAT